MNLQKNLYNPKFSHIYVEERVLGHFRTERILSRFPEAQIIKIGHYKDVFNRKHQNFGLQHAGQALILAAGDGNLVYKGADVCQDFGNDNFYYTSCVFNCIFDCEYCYLKGMYPSGNMVIFVNLEDVLAQVEELLRSAPVYLCVSYDTDLMAIESITGFVRQWYDFTVSHPGLKIEIRTKSARTDIYEDLEPCERVIFAYTVSPDYVAEHFEHGCAGMSDRIAAAQYALDRGFTVRMCFDPCIYCPDWKKEYGLMLEAVGKMEPERLVDVSVGTFRISQEYMKQMRKSFPSSAAVQFPYENADGVYQYPEELRKEMEEFMRAGLSEYIPAERIFFWKD